MDPLSPSIHPLWFFWPGTFGVAATIVAVRVARLARASGRSNPARYGLAAAPFVTLALPAVPMIVGIDVECADGTHFLSFNITALLLGAFGILAWLGVLWRLYLAAGLSGEDAQRPLGIIGGLVGLGMLVEFVVSSVSLEVYCVGSDPAPLYWHLGVAVAASVVVAAASSLARGK